MTVAYDLKSKAFADASLTITDVIGKKIMSYSIEQPKGAIILSPEITPGIYFVRIVNGGKVSEPVKVVKTR